MIWLVLRGELPSRDQAHLFGAVLVSAVDHGPQAPSIAVARMAATCGLGLNGAIASGVNTLGDVHGGTGQQCMELLQDVDARHVAGADEDSAAAEAIAAFREHGGEFIPGFGHRFHPIDPRAVRLSELVREAMRAGTVSGRYLSAGEAVQRALSRGKAKPLPMNIDGITAVVLLELGFRLRVGPRRFHPFAQRRHLCARLRAIAAGRAHQGPDPAGAGLPLSRRRAARAAGHGQEIAAMTDTRRPLPLDGIRVLEFGHTILGPCCGLVLADLGAEVIKIEPPEGERTRRLKGFGTGYFAYFNRNKKSVTSTTRRRTVLPRRAS